MSDVPCVRVPVLSEQMSVTAPSASRESSLRTITCRLAMARVPPARVIVRTTCTIEFQISICRRTMGKKQQRTTKEAGTNESISVRSHQMKIIVEKATHSY